MAEINLQKWSDSELIPLKEQRDDALWEIVYGLEKFYLTNEEKQYFLNALEKGAKFVDIKGNILTDKFLYIGIDIDKYNELKKQNLPNNPSYNPTSNSNIELTEEEKEKREKAREKIRQILIEKGIVK